MRDTKQRLELFSLFDHTHMEQHLTKMAASGWLIEKIGYTGWVYRRIEPANVTFSVTYFPDASDFDPAPTEEQETFRDFCAHTGWEFAASSAQMQIFYNRRPDPVPIETDPDIQIDNIHRSMKKSLLVSYGLLLLVLVMNLFSSVTRLRRDPVAFLCSTPRLLTAGAMLLMLVLILGELGGYFLWRRRAKAAAEQGLFHPTPNTSLLQRLCLAAAVLFLLGTLVSRANEPRTRFVLLLALGMMAVVYGVVLGGKTLMKRLGVPGRTNLIVTLCLCVFMPLVVTCVLYYGAFYTDIFPEFPQYTATSSAPLTLEMLTDVAPETLEVTCSYQDSTPLLGRTRFQQKQPYGLEQPRLSYTLVEVKLPVLYGRVTEAMLDEMCNQSLYERFGEDTPYSAVAADPTAWGAEAAWQLHYRDDTGLETVSDTWLLCYPGCIVNLSTNWTPTPVQMAIVGEIFGGDKR